MPFCYTEGSLSRGGLCKGGFPVKGGLCQWRLCPGGSLSRGSLSRGVSVQGVSQGDLSPPYSNVQAECILVTSMFAKDIWLFAHNFVVLHATHKYWVNCCLKY